MTKHAGGRPSEYKKEYITKVDEYLESRQDEVFEFHKTRGVKSDGYDRKVNVKLPTIEGFAIFINVSKKTLYNWRDENPKFLHALEKIEVEQKRRLLDSGLSGDYNSTIAKLILSSNHGMTEKTDITTGGEPMGVVMLPTKK